jgi:hypothetical protein
MTGYDDFVYELQKSRKAVFRVAEWLHRNGKAIRIDPIKVMPRGGNVEEWVDDCDLYADDQKIEVKCKNVSFTCKEDFPWDTVIVSNSQTVDRNWGLITAYIIVNKEMTHAMIIPTTTKDTWWKGVLKPKNKAGEQEFYFCKTETGIFRKITE